MFTIVCPIVELVGKRKIIIMISRNYVSFLFITRGLKFHDFVATTSIWLFEYNILRQRGSRNFIKTATAE